MTKFDESSMAFGRGEVSVTVTPVAANRDSRSLKQAVTMSRFGFKSFLLEGQHSIPPIILKDVELIGLRGLPEKKGQYGFDSVQTRRSLISCFRARATAHDASQLEASAGFLAYLIYYIAHFIVDGVRRLPRSTLYYLNEFSFFPAIWFKMLGRRSVLVYDARDFYSGMELPSSQTPFQRLIGGFGLRVERWCVRRADIFITVSDGVADLYERDFGRRPEIIWNAHDARIDHSPQISLRERINLTSDTPVIVIVGQAKAGRELSGVLEALRQLPQLHLALIGNGYREVLKGEQIAGIAENIHFIENVQATEVVPLIREADASVIVYYARSENYKNALPNGFFQSIAAGLPLLHSGIPEISKLCKELDFGVLVPPHDSEALTYWLGRVVVRDDWYRDQKLRSVKASQKLNWEREELKLRDLVIHVMDRKGIVP